MLVSHTAGIWNVETLCCESLHDASLACVARGCSSPMSFATCSSDGSVRLWDFDWQTDPLKNASSGHLLNKQSQSGNSLVKYAEQNMRSWTNSFAWE